MSNKMSRRLRPQRRPSDFKEPDGLPLLPLAERANSIYTDLLIAMTPLLLFSVYHYGPRPISIALISVFMSLGLDIAAKCILKRQCRFDLSPAVTGTVVALCLPATAPLWLPVIAAAVATVVSHAFGGNGKSPVCAPAVSVAAMFLIFPRIMTVVPQSGQRFDPFALSLSSFDAVKMTPLEKVFSGFLPDTTTWEMFFGLRSGMIGEMSGILIAVGFIYLLFRKAVKPTLPLVYLLTVGIYAYLRPSLAAASDFVALDGAFYNILDSNTMICAAYMQSDPKRSPKTFLGSVVAGVFSGILTMLLRERIDFGLSALLSVVAVNLLTPILDRVIKRAPFGGYVTEKEKRKSE